MMHWQAGPHRPPKKLPRWMWAILAIVYILSWTYAIMHTAQKNMAAASLPPVYEADVWPAAVIGGACAVLWGWWRKRGKNHS